MFEQIMQQKSKADFTVREIYYSNVSKGTVFLLRGISETGPKAKNVTVLNRRGCN